MTIVALFFPIKPRSSLCDGVELAGAAEVAEILDVTRQQVSRLARKPDFPAPVAVLQAGRVWRRRDIEKWAATRRRPGRPEKPYPR